MPPGPPIEDFRARVVETMRGIQAALCDSLAALEREKGGAGEFSQESWIRDGGGGGVTRVLVDGTVLEKAGVNFSAVHGRVPVELAEQLPGDGAAFFAAGVSMVLHPQSPHVPTCHANFRYLARGERAWFGGGADLTPCYDEPADAEHFHGVWRRVCADHPAVADHARFSAACDRYFYLPHRGERRGIGGIFFDYLWAAGENALDAEALLAFVRDAGHAVGEAYLPIARRRLDRPVTPEERRWQELRRGRYVEFNLLYDRGTAFGLRTHGRTESILMSLPPRVRWSYCEEPAPGTPEHALLERLRRPLPPESS